MREASELWIDNRLDEVERAHEWFGELARHHGLNDRVRRTVQLVLDELLNNIVAYAFDDDGTHRIQLGVSLAEDRLDLIFSDDGPAFDPLARARPDISLPMADREPGGLGILLVREMMDVLAYDRIDDRNVLTVSKLLDVGGG